MFTDCDLLWVIYLPIMGHNSSAYPLWAIIMLCWGIQKLRPRNEKLRNFSSLNAFIYATMFLFDLSYLAGTHGVGLQRERSHLRNYNQKGMVMIMVELEYSYMFFPTKVLQSITTFIAVASF